MEGEIIYSNKIQLFETCTELKNVSCVNYKPVKK